MICRWLLALSLSLVARRLHSTVGLLDGCWVLVAGILVTVPRQGRPLLRFVLPMCCSIVYVGLWLCARLRVFVVVTVAGHVIVTVWFCALWLLLCLWVARLAIIDTALGFCFKLKLLARRFHGGSRRSTKALQY